MYLTHNEGRSVMAKRFNTIINDSKSDIGYLNKLVNQYNNTYNRCIG